MSLPSENSPKKFALVTGAASGIGRALATEHASRGGNLIVTDKNSQGLEELKKVLQAKHKDIQVTIVVTDLALPNGAQSVYDQVKAAKLDVDYLINNAGFALVGSIIDLPLQRYLDQIQVMLVSVVTLTQLVASDMVKSGRGGKILNVGSTTGFFHGGPYMSTYFATKAFVSSFSQAVDQELRARGVTSTLLAPSYTDTALLSAPEFANRRVSKQKALPAEHVARIGYQGMLDGSLHVVCDTSSTIQSWLMPLLPRRKLLQMVDEMTQVDTEGP